MQTDFWSPIKLSLEVASFSGIIAIIFGIFAARFMVVKRFKGKIILETIFLLPLVLPPTVIGFLLIAVFGKNSPIGEWIMFLFHQPIMFTWWAAAIASTIVAFPLMYQTAKAGFLSIDGEIEDAARVDGAGEWRVFSRISVPLAYKAIIAGGILSFARALGEFGATFMFAGNIPGKTQTMPIAIYIALESGNTHLAWAWAGMMIAISFIMLLIVYVLKRE